MTISFEGLGDESFTSIPYQLHIDREAYYHSIFFAIMSVLGLDIEAEVSVAGGRVDAVLELFVALSHRLAALSVRRCA